MLILNSFHCIPLCIVRTPCAVAFWPNAFLRSISLFFCSHCGSRLACVEVHALLSAYRSIGLAHVWHFTDQALVQIFLICFQFFFFSGLCILNTQTVYRCLYRTQFKVSAVQNATKRKKKGNETISAIPKSRELNATPPRIKRTYETRFHLGYSI